MKKAHVGKIPGLHDYVIAFVKAGAPDGYLVKLGLIAEPDAIRARALEAAQKLVILDGADLK